jgi:hypothetical protein
MGGPPSTLSNIAGTLFPAALDLLLVPGRWTVGAMELLRPGFPARRWATIGPRELQGKPFAPTTNGLRGSQVPKLPLPSLPTWRSHLIASWKGNLADGPWTLLSVPQAQSSGSTLTTSMPAGRCLFEMLLAARRRRAASERASEAAAGKHSRLKRPKLQARTGAVNASPQAST